MKRLLKILALVVLVLAVAAGGLLAYTFMGQRGVVDGQQIDGIRIVADGFVSLAIVPIDDRQVVLIDAGEDQVGEAVLRELLRLQLGPEAVRAILLTHGHPDHIGAVGRFPNAQVMALEAEVPLVEGRAGSRGPVTRLFPVSPTGVTVTRALRDGDVVTIGSVPIRVYAVPGHTAGSAAYLVNGVLFVGDSANVASDGSLIGSPWIFSDSQAGNRASLVRLEQRLAMDAVGVTTIVPSHSGTAEGLAPLTAFARAQATD
jgi:glyoxylase-like metal-dependent hydrolase (beta-lactamase superfamily II)